MPKEVLGKCFPRKEAVLWWEMASWVPLPILAAHWMGPFEQMTWLMLVTLLTNPGFPYLVNIPFS